MSQPQGTAPVPRRPKAGTNSDKKAILDSVTNRTKAIALITLVAEALFVVAAYAIDQAQRINAFYACVLVLVVALLGCIWLEHTEARAAPVPASPIRPPEPNTQSYYGPKLIGDWLSFDSNPAASPPAGKATIEQTGNSVLMRLNRTLSRSGTPTNRTFVYRGEFREGQLTLLFDDEQARGYIAGAIVLRLSSDLKVLTGKTTYFDHDSNVVVSHDFFLKRP